MACSFAAIVRLSSAADPKALPQKQIFNTIHIIIYICSTLQGLPIGSSVAVASSRGSFSNINISSFLQSLTLA